MVTNTNIKYANSSSNYYVIMMLQMFGVSRDFSQCPGGSWGSVQGFDSSKLAGMG